MRKTSDAPDYSLYTSSYAGPWQSQETRTLQFWSTWLFFSFLSSLWKDNKQQKQSNTEKDSSSLKQTNKNAREKEIYIYYTCCRRIWFWFWFLGLTCCAKSNACIRSAANGEWKNHKSLCTIFHYPFINLLKRTVPRFGINRRIMSLLLLAWNWKHENGSVILDLVGFMSKIEWLMCWKYMIQTQVWYERVREREIYVYD